MVPARPWQSNAALKDRSILLYGPRGVGKTSYLVREAKAGGALYLSMDHPALSRLSVYDTVEALFQRGTMRVCLDEIHYAAHWSEDLKALHDAWPDRSVWASGSNSLLLSSGIGDLSRRYIGIAMPFLSFREFLVLKGYPDFGVHDPFSTDTAWVLGVMAAGNILGLFETYLASGLRPLFMEGEDRYATRILQVVQKTLEADIPRIVPLVAQNHFGLMNAVLGYLSQTNIPVVQVNSLCREWNVGKEKLYALLQAMEQTGLIRIVRKPSDHAARSIGAKLFLADPSLYQALSGKEGNAREAFAVCALNSAGHGVQAASDEREADFLVDNAFLVEIGGSRKARKKADFVIRDGADYPVPGRIPLWMMGFGW
ncbi:MAG: AAA family ATPase [Rectinemataceae bacterium]|nr:AAA family ATPase [Rectinemataceae bacterium]